nr:MAG TPA: hypothetical protein [Caudoviricetes sp.]
MDRLNGTEAKELMVPHTGNDTAALTAPFRVGIVAHGKIRAENGRHDNEHLTVNPALLLNQGTLKIGQNNGKVLRSHMNRIARSTKVDVVQTSGSAERGQGGNLSHHAAENKSSLFINIGLVNGFQQFLFVSGPVVTGLLDIERVKFDVLIGSETNLKTAGFSRNRIGNQLLVLLVRTHRPDFRSAHKLNNLVALHDRLKKFRVGNTGKPVFFVDFRKDNVAVPNSGKRSCFHSGITGSTGKHRHKLFS